MHFPEEVQTILTRLQAASFEAYAVGGAVRDLLLGKTPTDYDVATSARPDQVKKIFSDANVADTGIRYGTVTVTLKSLPVEITSFRVDGTYRDGRRPDKVHFSTRIEEDLARRDFTINAIAYDPHTGFIDPYGGRRDLEGKCIRCVGDPKERLTEDALRILRAIRFRSQLGFRVEEGTERSLHTYAWTLSHISAERKRDELSRLILGSQVADTLLAYADIMAAVIPSLAPCIGFSQQNPHHAYSVYEHMARATGEAKQNLKIRLAAMLHDIGKPECFTVDDNGIGHFYGHAEKSAEKAETILANLAYDRKTRIYVSRLIGWHSLEPQATTQSLRRFLHRMGREGFFDFLALKRADNKAQAPAYLYRQETFDCYEAIALQILAQEDCFSLRDLAVNGSDLITLGFLPGPALGAALGTLLQKVMDAALPNEKKALLTEAAHLLKEGEDSASGDR